MSKANGKLVSLAILLILALLSMGVSFPSTITNILITDLVFSGDGCDVDFTTSFNYSVGSSYQVSMTLYGDGKYLGGAGYLTNTSGTGSASRHFVFSGVAGSYDICTLTVMYYADSALVATRFMTYTNPERSSWFYTQPSAGEPVTSNHQTVLNNDVEACGVFEAGWYGRKYLTPENFPVCAEFLPDGVEVACMNEEAVWTADNVTGHGVSEGVFYAIVQQHGTCGIFPAG